VFGILSNCETLDIVVVGCRGCWLWQILDRVELDAFGDFGCRREILSVETSPSTHSLSNCNGFTCLDSRAYLTCRCLVLPHPTALHTRCRCWRGWDLVRNPLSNPLRNTCRAFVFCNVQKRSLRAGIGVIWRLVFGCWLCGILKLSLSTLCLGQT